MRLILNTRTLGTHSKMKSRMTASGGKLVGAGIEQKGKKTHGHEQQYGDCWGKRGLRGLNSNRKNI